MWLRRNIETSEKNIAVFQYTEGKERGEKENSQNFCAENKTDWKRWTFLEEICANKQYDEKNETRIEERLAHEKEKASFRIWYVE